MRDGATVAEMSESLAAAREFTLTSTFWATPELAEEIRKALESAATCLLSPTEETARATFELGAKGIYAVAQGQRDASNREAKAAVL